MQYESLAGCTPQRICIGRVLPHSTLGSPERDLADYNTDLAGLTTNAVASLQILRNHHEIARMDNPLRHNSELMTGSTVRICDANSFC